VKKSLKSNCLKLKRGDSSRNSIKRQARILAVTLYCGKDAKVFVLTVPARWKDARDFSWMGHLPSESCKNSCMKEWFFGKMPEFLHFWSAFFGAVR
jgi:hypothetical protein